MSLEAPGDSRAATGAGTLVLVVGPSGAGKDTILARAKIVLAPDDRFVFPRRVVTREADGSEDHDSLAAADFSAAEARGAFLLAWQAHGLSYGIPAAIADHLADGRVVVVNTSRRVIGQARQTVRAKVVMITAPRAVLALRLRARGRDEDILGRLDRDIGTTHDLAPDLIVDNGGGLDRSVELFCTFLRALAK